MDPKLELAGNPQMHDRNAVPTEIGPVAPVRRGIIGSFFALFRSTPTPPTPDVQRTSSILEVSHGGHTLRINTRTEGKRTMRTVTFKDLTSRCILNADDLLLLQQLADDCKEIRNFQEREKANRRPGLANIPRHIQRGPDLVARRLNAMEDAVKHFFTIVDLDSQNYDLNITIQRGLAQVRRELDK